MIYKIDIIILVSAYKYFKFPPPPQKKIRIIKKKFRIAEVIMDRTRVPKVRSGIR